MPLVRSARFGQALTPAGQRRSYATFATPPQTSDGDGGFGGTPVPLVPAGEFVSIAPATAMNLERITAGTTTATATHLVTLPYRDDITARTVMTMGGRTFAILSVQNPDGRERELVLVCAESV